MSTLKVGVIGVGHLGSLHARMFRLIPEADLVGVMDAEKNRAAALAEECGTEVFARVDELLSHVDAVSIATPTNTHKEIAARAMSCGKSVFIEKPIARTVAEAEELVKLATMKDVKIQVGHIERFNPAILALERYHLSPMFVESHRLAQFNPRGTDVDVVLDLMIHDIDLIVSLVKSHVEKVDANGVAVVSENLDIANARLQFANGCVANVTASRISQKKMRKMRLFQRDAYISIDFSEKLSEVFRLVDPNDTSAQSTLMLGQIQSGAKPRNIVYEQPEVKEVNALRHELELFVGAVMNNTDVVVSGEDGLEALKIADEIIRKIKQQRLPV